MKINNDFSEIFLSSYWSQKRRLSGILFSTISDKIVIKLEVSDNISTWLQQICVYADYVLILATTWQVIVDTFLKLKHEAGKSWPNS